MLNPVIGHSDEYHSIDAINDALNSCNNDPSPEAAILFADMEYDHAVENEGQEQPFISKISMRDELLSGNTTTLSLDNPKVRPLPDSVFNLNLLRQ